MSPLRVLRGFVFGAMGGVLGWLLIEFLPPPFPSPPFRPFLWERPGAPLPQVTVEQSGMLGLMLGLCIGGFLGLSEGMAEGTTARFRRVLAWFVGLGAVGGFLGLYFGQQLYTAMRGGNSGVFAWELLARSLGWALIGVFLGAIFGVPNFSSRRMLNGAVGGAIGGFLGGFFFQTLTSSQIFSPTHGRFVGFAMLGAAIGFFINLIAEALKRVWIKVLVGRNEGREFVVDTPIAYIGRDELADVPVFLDPSIPKRMASLRQAQGRYALHAESPVPGITVNGEPLIPGRLLKDGDAIQFGRVTLAYNEKATATGLRRPVDNIPLAEPEPWAAAGPGMAAPPAAPLTGACPYCGQMRDGAGNCACSVPVDAQAPVMAGGYGAADPMTAGFGAGYAPTMMDPGFPAGGGVGIGAQGPRLLGLGGPYAGQVFPLYSEAVSLGREPSQEIALVQDGTTSRRHATVYYQNGAWGVRDEGSANGTWVNGVRITDQPLFPGDVIKVGQTELRFEF
jgi:pSer/pThr/pTyr-binding forkhead associated (FHA) protein